LRVHIAAKGYLYRALPRGQGAVIPYNDKTTTKHANILALFDRAIKARVSQLTKAVAA
jgi:hypothetical protein